MTDQQHASPAVAVLVYPGFSEFEVTVALALLSSRFRVVNVGLNNHLVRGEGGLRVFPDQTIEETRADQFAALIIPGAADISVLALAPESLPELVADFAAQGKVVAAICGGPYLLGRAGLLEGKPYTATFTAKQREFLCVLPEAGFLYQEVVQQGNIISAQGHAFVEFGLAVAQALGALKDPERARIFYSGRGNPGMETDLAASPPEG